MKANPAEQIRTTMEHVLVELIDVPSALRIDVMIGEQTTVFEVHCDAKDRGKVIGKGGATANSLRHLLTCMAARNNLRAVLEICD